MLKLPDAEVVEVELVWSFRDSQGDELLLVLVDVGREVAPVAVLAVVEVVETALSEKASMLSSGPML